MPGHEPAQLVDAGIDLFTRCFQLAQLGLVDGMRRPKTEIMSENSATWFSKSRSSSISMRRSSSDMLALLWLNGDGGGYMKLTTSVRFFSARHSTARKRTAVSALR